MDTSIAWVDSKAKKVGLFVTFMIYQNKVESFQCVCVSPQNKNRVFVCGKFKSSRRARAVLLTQLSGRRACMVDNFRCKHKTARIFIYQFCVHLTVITAKNKKYYNRPLLLFWALWIFSASATGDKANDKGNARGMFKSNKDDSEKKTLSYCPRVSLK